MYLCYLDRTQGDYSRTCIALLENTLSIDNTVYIYYTIYTILYILYYIYYTIVRILYANLYRCRHSGLQSMLLE